MTDLIQRLTDATEGSRDLGMEVLIACGWTYSETALRREPRMTAPDKCVFAYRDTPDPTRSVDAALKLIPDGWLPELNSCRTENGNQYTWTIWKPTNREGFSCGPRRSMTIALCIAALRARLPANPSAEG